MNKKQLLYFLLIFNGLMLILGCKPEKPINYENAFDDAPQEIVELWKQARTEDLNREYIAAVFHYQSLMIQRDKVSPDQRKIISKAKLELYNRLNKEASDGDLTAKDTLETLRHLW